MVAQVSRFFSLEVFLLTLSAKVGAAPRGPPGALRGASGALWGPTQGAAPRGPLAPSGGPPGGPCRPGQGEAQGVWGLGPHVAGCATRAPCLGHSASRSRSTRRTLDAWHGLPHPTAGACALAKQVFSGRRLLPAMARSKTVLVALHGGCKAKPRRTTEGWAEVGGPVRPPWGAGHHVPHLHAVKM